MSLLTNHPQVISGVTEASLSEAQLWLTSQEAPVAHLKPVHQPVAAFDTVALAEQSDLGEAVSQLGMQVSGDVVGAVSKKALTRQGVQVLRTGLHAGVAGVSAARSGRSVNGTIAGVVAGDLATAPLAEATNMSALGKAMSKLDQSALQALQGQLQALRWMAR